MIGDGQLYNYESAKDQVIVVGGGGGGSSFSLAAGTGGGERGGTAAGTPSQAPNDTTGYAFGKGENGIEKGCTTNSSGVLDGKYAGIGGGGGG